MFHGSTRFQHKIAFAFRPAIIIAGFYKVDRFDIGLADIAGQQIADPTAAILSVALLLDHLGVPDAATTVRDAVTADIAGRRADSPRSTSAVGDAIVAAVTAALAH